MPPSPTTVASSAQSVRSMPTRSRSSRRLLEAAVYRRAPIGHSCWPRCAQNWPTGAHSSGARFWPTRPSPSPNPSTTTPFIVRVLNHIQIALQVPSLLAISLIRTAHALQLAERVGDPVQLFWAAQWRAEAAARAGDIDEMLRCVAIHGSMAQQLNQPIFNWGHAFLSAVPAQIAGDTDGAEALANEALRIGQESGQPDAETIFGAQFDHRQWPARDDERPGSAHRTNGCRSP